MDERYAKIHVATYEDYLKTENWRRENWFKDRPPAELEAHDKRMADKQAKRDEYAAKYPFRVIFEGSYPHQDFAHRWCWQTFGSPQVEKCGDAHSEYPACPLVLATEYIQTGSYPLKDGTIVNWSEKAYREVEDHSHEGTWICYWLGKTGYDFGFSEYFFENELDRDRLLAAAPTFTYGEKYEEGAK